MVGEDTHSLTMALACCGGHGVTRCVCWGDGPGLASRLSVVWLFPIECDIDVLKPFGALCFRLSGVGLAVTASQLDVVGERCQQSARIEAIGGHHVDLCAQQQG